MLTEANAYFAKHLDRVYWNGLDESTREAVLEMAQNDVAALLTGAAASALESDSGRKAVYEQAVFLARNHTQLTSGKIVTGQSLDGVGSQQFTLLNAAAPNLSPRAKAFLDQAKRESRPGVIRFNRG